MDSLGLYGKQLKLSQTPGKMFPKDLLDGFLQGNSSWTIKNFGLLYVPEKGGKIAIDASNYLRYKNIIAYETGRLLRMDNGQIVLGDSVIRD